jgi:hypothetical protein
MRCAISRKVLVSIPDGAIGIFNLKNPFSSTMALGLTQPLTEMSKKVKQSPLHALTGPESSRRFRLPDF